ncbi:5-methyltetrahydropteroyltriglutamate--homocysteine methyltransferase [Dirofilaria immitis]|nr:hypothetical protein [Dirofilaria immitis]
MRTQLQPFCTNTNCNRSCHQVHRRNKELSSPFVSISADFLKVKRNLSCGQNYSFAEEIGTKPKLMMVAADNSKNIFRTSQPTSKRAKTLEEIIELARRKSSCNYEEPSPQKHYVAANDDKLPVEEPAIRASEIVENNDDWIYLEQLMELDADRISLSGEPPITIDNDDDTSSTPGRRMCFNPSFS